MARLPGAERAVDRFARPLLRRLPPVVAPVGGLELELDPAQRLDRRLLMAPEAVDRAARRALAERLHPGDVFLDLGAYLGLYALLAARSVGREGRVLAVEPHPEARARLLRNLARHPWAQVEVEAAALSDRAGEAHLGEPLTGRGGGASLLKAYRPGSTVATRPLLEVLQRRSITRVTGAKLDLEGLEYRVLEDFLRRAPATLRPRFVLIEHHEVLVEAAGGDALALLRRYGYRLSRLSRLDWLAVVPP